MILCDKIHLTIHLIIFGTKWRQFSLPYMTDISNE